MRRHKYLGFALIAVGIYIFWSSILLPLGADHTSICGRCHAVSTAYNSTIESEHPYIGCLACHRSPSIGGRLSADFRAWRNLKAAFSDSVRQEKYVENDSCLACHDAILDGIVKNNKIKMSHREVIDAGWRCGECHGNTGHSLGGIKAKLQNPSMDKCLGCHASQAKLKQCDLCHIGGVSSEAPKSVAAMGSAAHGRDWKKKRHGQVEPRLCSACHRGKDCEKCHKVSLPHSRESWPYRHGAAAVKARKACGQCHLARFCEDCHKIEMPHPPDFEQRHGEKLSAVCLTCHFREQCASCHRAHQTHGIGALTDS